MKQPSASNTDKLSKYVLAIGLGIWIGELYFIFSYSLMEDFSKYYYAAKAVSTGLSPYAFFQRGDLLEGATHATFVFPTYFAWALVPLSHLTLPQAYAVWVLILYSSVMIGIWLFWDAWSRPFTVHTLTIGIWAIACPVVLVGVFLGQPTPLLFLLFALAYWSSDRGHPWLAGIVLSLGLFKPHILLVVAAGLALRRQWRILCSFTLSGIVLGSISFVPLATSLSTESTKWSEYLNLEFWRPATVSFARVVLPLPLPIRLGILLACYALLALWFWRQARIQDHDLALAFVVGVSLLPHVFHYDVLILLPAYLFLSDRSNIAFWGSVALLYPFFFRSEMAIISAFISICLLIVGLLKYRIDRSR
jgi:hypothetical protein